MKGVSVKLLVVFVFAMLAASPALAITYEVLNNTMLGGNYYHHGNTSEYGQPYNNINVSWAKQIYNYRNIHGYLEANVSQMSSPLAVNDMVFTAARNGSLYAIYLSNGSVRWSINLTDGPNFATPAYSPKYGMLYVGTRYSNNSLVCITSQNGSINWTIALDAQVETSPIVDGDYVFIAAGQYVYAYNATNCGQRFWRTNVDFPVTADLTYTGSRLYVPITGNIMTFTRSGHDASPPAFSIYGTPKNTSLVYDSDNESIYYTNSTHLVKVKAVASPPSILYWSAYLGSTSSSPALGYVNGTQAVFVGNATGVGAYNAATGSELWFSSRAGGTTYTPVIANDILYAGSRHTENGTLMVYNASTGVMLSNFSLLSDPGITRPVVANRTLLYIANGTMYAYRDMVYLENPANGNWSNAALDGNQFVIRTNNPYRMLNCTIYANRTGTFGSANLTSVSTNATAIANNTAYAITANFTQGMASNATLSGPYKFFVECEYGTAKVQTVNQTFFLAPTTGTALNVSISNRPTLTGFPGTTNNSWAKDPNLTLTFNVTANINQTLNCSIYIDGNTANTTTTVSNVYDTNKTGSFSNLNIPDGFHNVSYSCRDNAFSAIKTANISLLVDATEPTVTVNFNTAGALHAHPNGTVTSANSIMINITVNDSLVKSENADAGLTAGAFFNGTFYGNFTRHNISTTLYNFILNLTNLTNSPAASVTYNWSVRVNDSANNTVSVATYNVVRDATAPALTNVSLSLEGNLTDTTAVNGSMALGYLGQTFYVYVNTSEPNVNTSYFNVSVNNGTGATARDVSLVNLTLPSAVVNGSGWTLYRWSWTPGASIVADVTQRNLSVNLTLYDKAGNAVWRNNSVNFSLSSASIVGSIAGNAADNTSICTGTDVTVSGTIQTSGGTKLSGRVVQLTGATHQNLTTDANGVYSVSFTLSATGTASLAVRDSSFANSTSFTVKTCNATGTGTGSGVRSGGGTPAGAAPRAAKPAATVDANRESTTVSVATPSGNTVEVSVQRELDVFSAGSSGGSASSQVTVSVKNNGQSEAKNLEVRERIPDSITTDASQLQFSVQPDRFEQGSIIAVWEVASLAPGETFSVWYSVAKVVQSSAFKEGEATVALAGETPAGPGATPGGAMTVALTAPSSATVGETVTLTLTGDSGPAAGVSLTVVSPSSRATVLTTDSSGKAAYTASEAGTYTYRLPEGYTLAVAKSTLVSAKPSGPAVAAPAPKEQEKPAAAAAGGGLLGLGVVGSIVLVVVVLIIAIGAYMVFSKKKGKKGL